MTDDCTYLVLLRNGPIHSLDDALGFRLRTLSAGFRGELWATGSKGIHETVGRFEVNVEQFPEVMSRWQQLRYAGRVILRAIALRRARIGRYVVISYDPFRNGLIGLVASRVLGAPLAVEVNGCIGEIESYLDGRNSIEQARRKRRFMLVAGRAVLRRAAAIRLLFKEQLDGVLPRAALPRVVCHFDGIDLRRFSNIADEPFILFVGFPFFLKGVDVLVEAYLRIADQCPGWRLVLIGHDLATGVRAITSDQRVEVLRAMSNSEVAGWIGRCGVFVLPSRSEAMGRVLLEAAAAGKARIATRVGGTYTVVEHGLDGILVEPKNVQALADALLQLIRDRDLRERLGAAAKARAHLEFSDAMMVARARELVAAATAEGSR
jgi:glycosyltransferase involved in cell wall biosynthesis